MEISGTTKCFPSQAQARLFCECCSGFSGSLEELYLRGSIIRGKKLQGSLLYFCTPVLTSSMFPEGKVFTYLFLGKNAEMPGLSLSFLLQDNQENNNYW